MAFSFQNPRFCPDCHKAIKTCICKDLPYFSPIFPISFIANPKETLRAQNTGWLAHRTIKESTYSLEPEIPHIASNAAILFPSEEAKPWNLVPFQQLIILDGTWDECRGMFDRNPDLKKIPTIKLMDSYEGSFIGRRAPWKGALSTAEAIAYLLQEMGLPGDANLLGLVDLLNQREKHFRQISIQV